MWIVHFREEVQLFNLLKEKHYGFVKETLRIQKLLLRQEVLHHFQILKFCTCIMGYSCLRTQNTDLT
jgi:hypothetical protein